MALYGTITLLRADWSTGLAAARAILGVFTNIVSTVVQTFVMRLQWMSTTRL
jgi:hypothetical protein